MIQRHLLSLFSGLLALAPVLAAVPQDCPDHAGPDHPEKSLDDYPFGKAGTPEHPDGYDGYDGWPGNGSIEDYLRFTHEPPVGTPPNGGDGGAGRNGG